MIKKYCLSFAQLFVSQKEQHKEKLLYSLIIR